MVANARDWHPYSLKMLNVKKFWNPLPLEPLKACSCPYNHQVLLLLVEHRASMKSFQALRSPAIRLTSFHDLPVPLISSSVVLRHVLFGLPLLLYPWGFQSNAVFSIAPTSLCNVCPIQWHFLLFVWFSIGFCWVILHSSSFVILSVHYSLFVLSIYLQMSVIFLVFG
jgi:hypothetical protein